ncbi:MAG TPA: hypothetical protein VFY75_02950 [Solirubrobacterales bacterium]|nr:hypothetical protein [Solirubrobacterales bacterium]
MESNCAICGRTILAGERVHGYFAAEEERAVCELCLARAEQLGWRPAGEPAPDRGESHEGRLRGLLRRRTRRPGPQATAPRRQRPASPSLDEGAPTPFERAVARFNSSEAGQTVARLTRTLGVPRASVGASAGAPDEVRITIAWELSWYQWGVDIADELRPVFELDKGGEIDQIDAAARQWNAAVGEDGRLRLAGEPARSR